MFPFCHEGATPDGLGITLKKMQSLSSLTGWVSSVIARCQRLAGDIAVADREDIRDRVEALASSLATPPSRAHNLVLAPLLLETAFHIADHAHRGVAAAAACPCRQITPTTIRGFLNWREQDASRMFKRWTDEFFQLYDLHHPRTAADRLARLMRQHPDRAWTLASLVKTAGVPPRGLARAFRRQFGVPVRTYLHVCRIDTVLERLSPEVKIEAIALEVGYRSRKDFYRVLRQLLQTTPALLRRLSHARRSVLRW